MIWAAMKGISVYFYFFQIRYKCRLTNQICSITDVSLFLYLSLSFLPFFFKGYLKV